MQPGKRKTQPLVATKEKGLQLIEIVKKIRILKG